MQDAPFPGLERFAGNQKQPEVSKTFQALKVFRWAQWKETSKEIANHFFLNEVKKKASEK